MMFSFLMALIGIAGGVFIIMLIVKSVNRSQEIKQQTYMKTLEKGIYDYRLIGAKPDSGTAVLGWGILFTAIGLALLISFIFLGIISEALPGSLVPMFIGIGMVVYYVIRKNITSAIKTNGDPVRFDPPGGTAPKIADSDE